MFELGLLRDWTNIKLMEHIIPITWDDVILYGKYVLNCVVIEV